MDVKDIELELSTYCNADCPLCYRNYKSFRHHYPNDVTRPLVDITNQLDGFRGLEWVRLVGSISEPTLYSELFGLISYIKSRNIRIEMCTNGDTHTPDWWSELSSYLDADDRVYFTICGSTQRIHETYRRGTSLERILNNARAFRSDHKNDYAQCIRFKYNSDDFDGNQFKSMVSVFSHVYWTETFLVKDLSNYTDPSGIDMLYPCDRKVSDYLKVSTIADAKFRSRVKGKAKCMSIEKNLIQIDVNGKVYPCYLFLEASGGEPWDGDYNRIEGMEYEVCKYCDRAIIDICDSKDLRYII